MKYHPAETAAPHRNRGLGASHPSPANPSSGRTAATMASSLHSTNSASPPQLLQPARRGRRPIFERKSQNLRRLGQSFVQRVGGGYDAGQVGEGDAEAGGGFVDEGDVGGHGSSHFVILGLVPRTRTLTFNALNSQRCFAPPARAGSSGQTRGCRWVGGFCQLDGLNPTISYVVLYPNSRRFQTLISTRSPFLVGYGKA